MESLFKVLEFDKVCENLSQYAISPLGKELALELTPITDTKFRYLILSQVTELRDLISYDQAVPLEGLSDIRTVLKRAKLVGTILRQEEFADLAKMLILVRRLVSYFKSREEKIPFLKKLIKPLVIIDSLEKEIIRCIDVDTFEVKDSASPKLAQIRRDIKRAQEAVRRKIESLQKNLGSQGFLQENVISVREGRLVLVVKDEYKRKIKGLVHGQSASGASYFVEPLETLDDNNRVRELQTEETKEIERILFELSNLVHNDVVTLSHNLKILAKFDLLYAKADYSRVLNAQQVELVDRPFLHLASARHPLLVQRLGEKATVPLDIILGEKFHTLIISGPNAGGKTVTLKTIGLLTLMTLCGLHIPALPHSKIGCFESIFSCIGDQQSIENDLSTFSAHLQNLHVISENADLNSLVLIDEIGSGTDPEEGTALAMSLLERLTARKCLSVVTTHHGALKVFAHETPDVENGSMEFKIETLEPTYRFMPGLPGSSYAFEIAKRMGISNEILNRARSIIGGHKGKMESLLLELEQLRQQNKDMVSKNSIKQSELDGLLELYGEKTSKIKREEKLIKRRAVEEAEEIIRQANVAVELAVKEIKEKNADKNSIRDTKSLLKDEAKKIEKIKKDVKEETPNISEQEPIQIGDFVKWKTMGTVGKVLSEKDKKNRVLVQVEGVKMKLLVTDLIKTKRQKQKKSLVNINLSSDESLLNEIDLRGMTEEDAREAVDRFIDETLLTGLEEIRIVHGKGTGKLRQGIGQFLQNHPQVSKFRLGYWNEGDSGVTVVRLRK